MLAGLAGLAGPALTILFSLYFCNKQMATISSVLQQMSGTSSVLEEHIWGISSGWAGPTITILVSMYCSKETFVVHFSCFDLLRLTAVAHRAFT